MKPLPLSFTTFLKICAKKPRGKIGEVKRFTKKGGYDFYKRLKLLCGQIARKEINLADAKQIAAKITRPSERQHTLAALDKFGPWLTKSDFEWVAPPSGTYKSDSGLLIVKLTPTLAFKKPDGKIQCLHLWNLDKPTLNDELAGEGVWLLADELGKPGNEFGILDLRKQKTFGEETISAASGLQLMHDLLTIEEIWKDIHNPALTAEDTLKHIASLMRHHPPSP